MRFGCVCLLQGQEDILKQYPEVKNNRFLNSICAIDCGYSDREEEAKLFEKIGENSDISVWGKKAVFDKGITL